MTTTHDYTTAIAEFQATTLKGVPLSADLLLIEDSAAAFAKKSITVGSLPFLSSLSGAILADQTTPQTIGDTTRRLLKLWATDITCTNKIAGSITGNADGSAASFTGSLAGDVTGTQGSTAVAAATVTGKLITGFSSGAGIVAATDTILQALNKLDGNIALKSPLASPYFTGTLHITCAGSAQAFSLSHNSTGNYAPIALINTATGGKSWYMGEGNSGVGKFTLADYNAVDRIVVDSSNGAVTLSSLAGSGNRPVYADANGKLYC